jgi:hypothetical protein
LAQIILGEGILNCSNEGDYISPRGDNSKNSKYALKIKKKIFLFRTSRRISIWYK